MDSDSMKKYSDKLFFTLLSGGELDDDDLQEITNHMLAEDQAKREQLKENGGAAWSIAYDKKDTLKLLPGEYPQLFKIRMKEVEEDKFSENVFNVTDQKGSALFVPTPASLLLGDLLRANKDISKLPFKVSNTLAKEDPYSEEHYDEMYGAGLPEDFQDFESEPSIDFSNFGKPVEPPKVDVNPPEASVEAERKTDDQTPVQILKEFAEDLAAVGILLVDAVRGRGKELLHSYVSWLSRKKKKGND